MEGLDIVSIKKEIRRTILDRRNALKPSIKSRYDQAICERLYANIKSANVSCVHSYLPIGSEIDVLPLLDNLLAETIRIVCPQIIGKRKMRSLELTDTTKLKEDSRGTLIPDSDFVYDGPVDVIIVPGLAFTKNGDRLGYGGGYYDDFLSQNRKASSVGLAYPFQILDTIPTENHDVKLDKVLYLEAL